MNLVKRAMTEPLTFGWSVRCREVMGMGKLMGIDLEGLRDHPAYQGSFLGLG